MTEFAETESRPSPHSIAPTNPGAISRLRGITERHPEWWMMLLAAAAWAFLIAQPRAHAGHGGADGLWPRAVGLGAMVIAMMLPLTAGSVLAMARGGSPLRLRATAAFLVGYLAVWMLAMFAIDGAWRLTLSAAGWTAAAGIVIAAAVLWEVAPARWRRAHHRDDGAAPHTHGNPMGAGRVGVGVGVAAGTSCVAACWALMAACVAFAHSLPVMAAFFLVQLYGRYRRPASPALAAAAILGICLVSLAVRMAGGAHHHPHI